MHGDGTRLNQRMVLQALRSPNFRIIEALWTSQPHHRQRFEPQSTFQTRVVAAERVHFEDLKSDAVPSVDSTCLLEQEPWIFYGGCGITDNCYKLAYMNDACQWNPLPHRVHNSPLSVVPTAAFAAGFSRLN